MTLRSIDFLRTRTQPVIGWALLAAGVCFAIAAMSVDQQWRKERDEALRLHDARLSARRAAQTPAPPPAPTAADRRLGQAAPELNRPWMPALRAVEAATVDPVYLLSAAFDPRAGTVKLDAEAPSFEHALAYVQVLPDGVGLSSATLASHEQFVDPNSGRAGVRFAVLAHWSAR